MTVSILTNPGLSSRNYIARLSKHSQKRKRIFCEHICPHILVSQYFHFKGINTFCNHCNLCSYEITLFCLLNKKTIGLLSSLHTKWYNVLESTSLIFVEWGCWFKLRNIRLLLKFKCWNSLCEEGWRQLNKSEIQDELIAAQDISNSTINITNHFYPDFFSLSHTENKCLQYDSIGFGPKTNSSSPKS